MQRISLQPRLQKLYDLVPFGAHLADVGTDHGYLPTALLADGKISFAIASDINDLPLRHARRTAADAAVQGIHFRLCSGLELIEPHEVDTVVIAGMGGETIITILQNAPWAAEGAHTFLLQPQTKAHLLRLWLTENGFSIEQEHLVRDKGTLYVILTVRPGGRRALTPAEAYGGVTLLHDPLYGDYLTELIRKLDRAAEGLHCSQREDRAMRIAETVALRDALAKKRKEWEECRR